MHETPKFFDHITKCVKLGVYDKEILDNYTEEEIATVERFIDHERDYLFTYGSASSRRQVSGTGSQHWEGI